MEPEIDFRKMQDLAPAIAPRAPHPGFQPEREQQQKVVVFLHERKQGARQSGE